MIKPGKNLVSLFVIGMDGSVSPVGLRKTSRQAITYTTVQTLTGGRTTSMHNVRSATTSDPATSQNMQSICLIDTAKDT